MIGEKRNKDSDDPQVFFSVLVISINIHRLAEQTLQLLLIDNLTNKNIKKYCRKRGLFSSYHQECRAARNYPKKKLFESGLCTGATEPFEAGPAIWGGSAAIRNPQVGMMAQPTYILTSITGFTSQQMASNFWRRMRGNDQLGQWISRPLKLFGILLQRSV